MKYDKRNSSIEILRIFAMFLIILSHCCVHGLAGSESSLLFNNIVLDICVLGNLGVVIFVLITGYLSVNKSFKLKKIFYLEFITIIYSLVFFVFSVLITGEDFFGGHFVKSLFPIIFKRYWFMTAYISLYIFTPFINLLISLIPKEKFLFLIYVSVFSGFVIPTFTTADLYFNELFQFFTIYCIGGYIRKYINVDQICKYTNFLLIVLVFCLVISTVIIEGIASEILILSNYGSYFLNRNSIFILLLGTCILIFAIKKEKHSCKKINLISSTMLGVYLIHDNPDFRTILWNDIIDLTIFVDKPYLIFVLVLTAICVLLLCIIIELFRKKCFDNILEKTAQKLDIYLTKKFNKLLKMNNDGCQ